MSPEVSGKVWEGTGRVPELPGARFWFRPIFGYEEGPRGRRLLRFETEEGPRGRGWLIFMPARAMNLASSLVHHEERLGEPSLADWG